MNRCTSRLVASSLLAFSAALAGLPAAAQNASDPPIVREFPKNAMRGQLVVLAPPEISMDGKPDRLAPGARLRSSDNLLLLTGQVINQNLTVNYLRQHGTGAAGLGSDRRRSQIEAAQFATVVFQFRLRLQPRKNATRRRQDAV